MGYKHDNVNIRHSTISKGDLMTDEKTVSYDSEIYKKWEEELNKIKEELYLKMDAVTKFVKENRKEFNGLPNISDEGIDKIKSEDKKVLFGKLIKEYRKWRDMETKKLKENPAHEKKGGDK